MLERIDQITEQAKSDLTNITDAADLEKFRVKYLGHKGVIKTLWGELKNVPSDQKPRFGQRANALRTQVQQMYEDKRTRLGNTKSTTNKPLLDITEPGLPPKMGRTHIITQTMDELIEVFGRMGFDVATGPEVEDDYHNFVALNIPEAHPARDPLDNFYLDLPSQEDGGNHSNQLLRSQTSTVQIRVMEKEQPPIRVISPGRVYRPDEHDATHVSMFHQIEGLFVDRGVTMADLKTLLVQFTHAYFGSETEIRLRPSFFPFTEPSAELDIKMQVKDKWDWVELGGCGMVDPNVFEAVGYDPQEWSGFAFGLGIERIAMRKYGIADIRWLFENDIRFLRQF